MKPDIGKPGYVECVTSGGRREVRLAHSGGTAKGYRVLAAKVLVAADPIHDRPATCAVEEVGWVVDVSTMPSAGRGARGWVIVNDDGETLIGSGAIRGDQRYDALWAMARYVEAQTIGVVALD